jgi:hypothetical protein
MKITLERRDQYGAPVYHPIDDAARLFARIAKTKTLTPDTIAAVRALGYQIEITHPKNNLEEITA